MTHQKKSMVHNNEEATLLGLLSRFWWLMVLRGLAVALYGFLTFVSPDNAVVVSASLFGIYMLLIGILALVLGLRTHRLAWRGGTFIIPGLISVAAAAMAFVMPGITLIGVIGLGGMWSIVVGLMEIILAIHLRKAFFHQITLLTAGFASTLLGASILRWPWEILLLDLRKIQVASLLLGVLLSLLAFGMRRMKDKLIVFMSQKAILAAIPTFRVRKRSKAK